MAWSIAKKSPMEYDHILEHWDILQLIEAYAFSRVDYYLEIEEHDTVKAAS